MGLISDILNSITTTAHPAVWLVMDKISGENIASGFEPDCRGRANPMFDLSSDQEAAMEILFFDLNRSPELLRHIADNLGPRNSTTTPRWQFKLGILTGHIVLGKAISPLITTTDSPGLHKINVKCLDYTFTKPTAEVID